MLSTGSIVLLLYKVAVTPGTPLSSISISPFLFLSSQTKSPTVADLDSSIATNASIPKLASPGAKVKQFVLPFSSV